MKKALETLSQKIIKANNVLVFSGAGISTESGIPDFRSETGLWKKIDPELISVSSMKHNPKIFFANYEKFVSLGQNKKANKGHLALAKMEEQGFIKAIATQNIDGLHQEAGSKNVIELHGNVKNCICTACQKEYAYSILSDLTKENKEVKSPCCEKLLRPTITLFEDPMPPAFQKLVHSIKKYDFCLVVGSSLTVSPANSIPLSVNSFAIINKEPTVYDELAEVVLHANLGETLESLLAILMENS